ncbi:MAG TPA: hypothetical protein DIC52_18950 [Candidatus Latescibacteria bacterium]|nr:hypothetical protein [Candidatus Latescibacterota bacterium]
MTGGLFLYCCQLLLLLAGGCASPNTDREAAPRTFVDVTPTSGFTRQHTGGGPDKGYIVEAKGGGSAILDADGDGNLDIFWVNGATLEDPTEGAGNALYHNDGDLRFTDVASQVGVARAGWGMGAVAADYDNDGDSDLYVTCLQDNTLLRNEGGHFLSVGAETGVGTDRWSTGAAFGDYDLDGDLDLYVADYVHFDPGMIEHLGTKWKGIPAFVGPLGLLPQADHLFRNDEGRFIDVSSDAGVGAVDPGYGLGVIFLDYDNDGDSDIYVANDSSPNFLFHNDGGTFRESALIAQLSHGAMGNAQAGMGVAVGDYDADGAADLLVTNFEDDYNTLYHNGGNGSFEDVSFASGLAQPSLSFVGFGAIFLDFDHDSDLDIFVANGHVYPEIDASGTNSSYAQSDHLFSGDGAGHFELFLPGGRSPFEPRVSRGASAADFDNDGDLDLFVTHLNDRPALYRNDAASGNWLGIRLLGRSSNRAGVGAKVVVHSGGLRQIREAVRGSSFLSSEDPRLHFGLGSALLVDSLTVYWPAGGVQRLRDIGTNRYLSVQEP